MPRYLISFDDGAMTFPREGPAEGADAPTRPTVTRPVR
jgi:hypothetical protein